LPSTQYVSSHTSPQLPQLLLSLVTSVHTPLQRWRPPEQPHDPFSQLVPLGQMTEQPPQFSVSFIKSTQDPLHLV
jgi:hypothetical protein